MPGVFIGTRKAVTPCPRCPRRVHANTIAVYQPGEFFPTLHTIQNGATANVNDGGQRPMRRDKSGSAFPK